MATFATNAFEQSGLGGVRAGLEFFINLGVNERVDATYEKAGHTGNLADVLTLRRTSLERSEERFGNLFVRRLRKEQRDIDVDAFFESLANGREAFRCGRES